MDFAPADPETTGQVMALRRRSREGAGRQHASEPAGAAAVSALGPDRHAAVSLNEQESATVRVRTTTRGAVVADCLAGEPFGPSEADLGTVGQDGTGVPLGWDEPITENPALGAVEVWEIHNFTADAHPIHIHEVTFEVLGRRS